MSSAYAWNAEDYARNSAGQQQWAQDLLEQLRVQPGESVLDIGCGDGKVTAQLAAQAAPATVLGVDRSLAMVRLAHQTHGPLHLNLRFCQQDAAHLGLAKAFDVVFSNATLHWVSDHPAVLRGVYQALRPGGRLLFQMGGAGNAADVVAVAAALTQSAPWQTYFTSFVFPYTFATPQDYQRWLPQAGLRLLRAELLPRDLQHAGADGLAGWLRTTWLPYLARIPQERQAEFLAQWVERYLDAHPLDADGIAHVAMQRLEVAAERPL